VGRHNLLTVDWARLAESPWFNTASRNCKLVGRVVAEFTAWLVTGVKVDWDQVHIIGASMGALCAGYAGYFTQGRLGRITGLDPSGPLTYTVAAAERLDSSDAQFVDVIHTAGYWVGAQQQVGHVDFFPNGGLSPQPGCRDRESLDLSCSHWQVSTKEIIYQRILILCGPFGLNCTYSMWKPG